MSEGTRRIPWVPLRLVGVIFLAIGALVQSMSTQDGMAATLLDKVPTTQAAAAQPPPRPRVALVMKTLTSPFFVAMERGARRAESEFGIDLLVRTAAQETSIEQQIAIVEQLTPARIDALVIAPGDSYGLIPALKKTQDKGIPIVNIDNRIDPEFARKVGLAPLPFISVDNVKGAYLAAQELSRGVVSPAKAAIIEGIRSSNNANARKLGALQAFSENQNITVVASEAANWKIDEGYNVARNLFARHPDITLLFCANDMMALGALRFLDESGNRSVKVAGYDALEEAKRAIRAGSLGVSIDQQAEQQGFLGVAYAVRALKGEVLPSETILEVRPVTAETLAGQ